MGTEAETAGGYEVAVPPAAPTPQKDWSVAGPTALLLTLAGLAFVVDAWSNLREFRETYTWPEVPARILRCDVTPYERPSWKRDTTNPSRNRPRLQAEVEFEYWVGEERWITDQVWIRGDRPLFASSEEARQFQTGRFPVGKEVPAYVSPADPSQAVLLRGSQYRGEGTDMVVATLLGIACLVLAGFCVFAP